jgi:signal transduction histidine kinase/DNA-binding NarL/FixJ family response regulator
MTKIKYFFIFLFFVYNANSQTEQLISVDSLQKIFYQNYKIKKNISPNEFTITSQNFLKLLNSQRLIYKSLTNKKLLQNNEYDIDTLNFFQAKTYIDLMVYGNIKNNIDSIQLYKKKVSNITSDSLLIGQSYGTSAYTYLKNKMYSKAIIDYQIASSYFKNSKKSGSQNSQITNFINLINTHIVIGTLEQASITLNQLNQVIINLPNHPRFKNLMELVKIQKVKILVAKEDYDDALPILQTVKEKNLDKDQLKVMYYGIYHKVYNGLNNYTLGEFYLDKKYNHTYKQNPGLFKDLNYTIEKLRYAIFKDNKTQADYYFNKLNNAKTFKLSSLSEFSKEKVMSNYYAFKNSYKKAYSYLKKSDSLQNAASIKMDRIKFDVEQYYVQLDQELSKMKQLNLDKDKLLVVKRKQYFMIGFLIVFVLASIFLIINEKRKKKQFQLEVSLESQKTILESKEKFLENMSHEIRTPITSIIGYLNLLSEENLVNEKRTKYTKTAIKNSNKMISSINNFLTLLKSDKLSLVQNEKTSFNLNDFILERITYYIPDFEIKKIKLYYKTNVNDKVAITYDNESLKAIINNLISNAIKYSNSNTSVYFTFNITESNLIISVKDEGLGISEKDKEKIFERFYQTSNNKTIGGFGIGLSLITELVKRLKGTIDLESELNKGSLFKVSLPYKLSNFNTNTSLVKNDFKLLTDFMPQDEAFKSTKNYPKVLIVDDNTQMISYLKDIFSGFLDCRFAFNGKEAITKVKNTAFDLIISDVRMPEMDGFQFKKELNETSDYREIPFILISSVSNKTANKLKTELGINEYLEKPFTKNEIISRVQLSLERTLNRKKIVGEKNTTVFDSSSNKLIEEIRECIISNITNPALNVNMLAETCGYNQKRLNEILKFKLGLSLVNVILEVKLLKAYELIVKNKFPTIKEVMFSVGINSRPYFYKKFNERFGIKIGELKNKYSQLS